MSSNTHRHRAPRQVFGTATGRRRRSLRVAGAIGVLGGTGYLSLLLFTGLGPAIQSGMPPLPEATSQLDFAAQHPRPLSPGWTTRYPGTTSTGQPTVPTMLPTSSPAARPTSSVQTSTTSDAKAGKGKPTTKPTPPNRPTKTPR